jgi:hypothetical protein
LVFSFLQLLYHFSSSFQMLSQTQESVISMPSYLWITSDLPHYIITLNLSLNFSDSSCLLHIIITVTMYIVYTHLCSFILFYSRYTVSDAPIPHLILNHSRTTSPNDNPLLHYGSDITRDLWWHRNTWLLLLDRSLHIPWMDSYTNSIFIICSPHLQVYKTSSYDVLQIESTITLVV